MTVRLRRGDVHGTDGVVVARFVVANAPARTAACRSLRWAEARGAQSGSGLSPSPCRPGNPRSKLLFFPFSARAATGVALFTEGHLKVSLLNFPSLHNSFDSGAVLPRRESTSEVSPNRKRSENRFRSGASPSEQPSPAR